MSATDATNLAPRLDREWERLARHRQTIEHARSWGLTDRPIDHLDQLLSLAGYRGNLNLNLERSSPGGGDSNDDPNEVLRRLTRLAAGDQLAGRVVLQRILPGLRHRARRWRYGHDGRREDPLGDLVAVAWVLITTYDVEHRRGFVAANLVRDASHQAFVAPKRRSWCAERPTDRETVLDGAAERGPDTPCTELLVLLAEARRDRVEGVHVELLRDLFVADGSTADLAAERKVTTRMIRYRRTAATRALRDFALCEGTPAA